MTSSMEFARYAVYWAPEEADPLHAFGATWLGHDPTSAGPVVQRNRLGLPAALADDLTAEPRRYGLHATLKAPFRAKPGVHEAHIVEVTAALARSVAAFKTELLRLTNLQGFLALCPQAPSPALDDLARRCVTELDFLRAPLSCAERTRRNPQHLSLEQRQLLETWGYQHVLQYFRFHITLTKRLTEAERIVVAPVLETATRPFCSQPFSVNAIALFGDPGGGRPFRLIQRFPLSAAREAA